MPSEYSHRRYRNKTVKDKFLLSFITVTPGRSTAVTKHSNDGFDSKSANTLPEANGGYEPYLCLTATTNESSPSSSCHLKEVFMRSSAEWATVKTTGRKWFKSASVIYNHFLYPRLKAEELLEVAAGELSKTRSESVHRCSERLHLMTKGLMHNPL